MTNKTSGGAVLTNIVVTLLLLSCMNSCAFLQAWVAADEAVSFLDTFDERTESGEKIAVVIENKTDETLVMFVLFSTTFNPYKRQVGAELARLPAHSVKEMKVTQGKEIRITGGNSGFDYMDITCNQQNEAFIVYPAGGLSLPDERKDKYRQETRAVFGEVKR